MLASQRRGAPLAWLNAVDHQLRRKSNSTAVIRSGGFAGVLENDSTGVVILSFGKEVKIF